MSLDAVKALFNRVALAQIETPQNPETPNIIPEVEVLAWGLVEVRAARSACRPRLRRRADPSKLKTVLRHPVRKAV